MCMFVDLYRDIHYTVSTAKNELEVLADINEVLYKVSRRVTINDLMYNDDDEVGLTRGFAFGVCHVYTTRLEEEEIL